MVEFPSFATKRFPAWSKAIPCGWFSPVLAKTDPTPLVVNFSIVFPHFVRHVKVSGAVEGHPRGEVQSGAGEYSEIRARGEVALLDLVVRPT